MEQNTKLEDLFNKKIPIPELKVFRGREILVDEKGKIPKKEMQAIKKRLWEELK